MSGYLESLNVIFIDARTPIDSPRSNLAGRIDMLSMSGIASISIGGLLVTVLCLLVAISFA